MTQAKSLLLSPLSVWSFPRFGQMQGLITRRSVAAWPPIERLPSGLRPSGSNDRIERRSVIAGRRSRTMIRLQRFTASRDCRIKVFNMDRHSLCKPFASPDVLWGTRVSLLPIFFTVMFTVCDENSMLAYSTIRLEAQPNIPNKQKLTIELKLP
jgi:hypothetical protein